MRVIVLISLFLSFNSVAQAELIEAMRSTCRIRVSQTEYKEIHQMDGSIIGIKTEKKGYGTGVVYEERDGEFWIITAGHVLNLPDIHVQFFLDGKNTEYILAKKRWMVYQKGGNVDVGLITIPSEKLRDKIKPIPFSHKELKNDDTVFSCGCPHGTWPTAWMGRVINVSDHQFIFNPLPERGRSGSAIFTKDGKSILGIVLLSNGTAVSVNGIYNHVGWKRKRLRKKVAGEGVEPSRIRSPTIRSRLQIGSVAE